MKRILTLVAGLAVADATVAQAPPAPAVPPARTERIPDAAYRRMSTVIGSTVTLGAERLGRVTDVVADDGGLIQYLIVTYGDSFVALPWRAVSTTADPGTLALRTPRLTREQLRDLAFPETRWPVFTDPVWTRSMQTVWGEAIRPVPGTVPLDPLPDRRLDRVPPPVDLRTAPLREGERPTRPAPIPAPPANPAVPVGP